KQFRNMEVYNNTFININSNVPVFGSLPITFSNNIARNNLFSSVGNPGGGSVWGTMTHNHFIATSPIGTNTSIGVADPFVNSLGLDFQLTAATPAGQTLAAPYTSDMLGHSRG